MKKILIILSVLVFSCKNQQTSNTPQSAPEPDLVSIADYTPNPDEVILNLKNLGSKQSGSNWETQAEVISQVRAGFGFKGRLSPGEKIVVISKMEISSEEFYCAANSDFGEEKFTLNALLKK